MGLEQSVGLGASEPVIKPMGDAHGSLTKDNRMTLGRGSGVGGDLIFTFTLRRIRRFRPRVLAGNTNMVYDDLTASTVVPEPASLGLLAVAAGLVARRRRA